MQSSLEVSNFVLMCHHGVWRDAGKQAAEDGLESLQDHGCANSQDLDAAGRCVCVCVTELVHGDDAWLLARSDQNAEAALARICEYLNVKQKGHSLVWDGDFAGKAVLQAFRTFGIVLGHKF